MKRAAAEDEMPIRTLAAELGVSTATINFYVQEGVLPPPRKLNRTRAAYSSHHLRLLKLIKVMQASGYSLAQVKGAFEAFGTDARGLKKMESIGTLRPFAPPKTDRDQRPTEHFTPVDRASFAVKAGASQQLVDELVACGLLRPLPGDRFDARDVSLLRSVRTMLDDGIDVAELAFLADVADIARRAHPLVLRRALLHRDALLARTLRFSDLLEPFGDVFGYLFDRLATVRDPDWLAQIFSKTPDR